jgi:uncharacterized protein (DUF2384 family)
MDPDKDKANRPAKPAKRITKAHPVVMAPGRRPDPLVAASHDYVLCSSKSRSPKATRRITSSGAFELAPAYRSFERVRIEREGVPAKKVEYLRKGMGLQIDPFSKVLGIKLSTYKKKVSDQDTFKGSYGYAVSDLDEILSLIGDLVPDDKKESFDPMRWFAQWMTKPQASLGGLPPQDLLDTPTGRHLVKRVIGAIGSGSYL